MSFLRTQIRNCRIWSDWKYSGLLPLVVLALSGPEEALQWLLSQLLRYSFCGVCGNELEGLMLLAWGQKSLFPHWPTLWNLFCYYITGKESTCNAGDLGSIFELGRSSGERKCYPLQYSGLENSMDCVVLGVANSDTTEPLSFSLSNNKVIRGPNSLHVTLYLWFYIYGFNLLQIAYYCSI